MKKIKKLLAKTLYYSNSPTIVKLVSRNNLVIFNYHRIRPDSPDFSAPFDDGVFGPTASEFAKQIRWLKRNTRILSEGELINCLNSRKSFSRPSVLITFDDGYRDNYTIANPILKALGVPAIFFIPTKQIMTRRLGPWDITAYLIKRTTKPRIIFEEEPFDVGKGRREIIEQIQEKIKVERYEKLDELVIELSEACEVSVPHAETQDRELMSWDEIKEISNDTITIGSHTHTHRALATLDVQSQREEMISSKSILEHKTGKRVRSVAYPFGEYQHFTEQTTKIALECGYDLGFSFLRAANNWRTLNPFELKRFAVPEEVVRLSVMTVLPEIFT